MPEGDPGSIDSKAVSKAMQPKTGRIDRDPTPKYSLGSTIDLRSNDPLSLPSAWAYCTREADQRTPGDKHDGNRTPGVLWHHTYPYNFCNPFDFL